jgi:hypothetical protein
MFYRQCNNCNERWELGTASTCTCVKNEPVAWIWEKEDGYTSIETHSLNDEDMKNVGVKSMKPLYTTPPQRPWVVLTDKEIEAIWKVALFADYGVGAELSNQPFVHYARAIEAKLKEKNT